MVKISVAKKTEALSKRGLRPILTHKRRHGFSTQSEPRIVFSHSRKNAESRIPKRFKDDIKIVKLINKKDKRKNIFIFARPKGSHRLGKI